MKIGILVALVSAAAAVEYSAKLKEVISLAPFHTLRLSEIDATVTAGGPMDQVGALCNQQMREISAEIEDLDATHERFDRDCRATLGDYNNQLNKNALSVSQDDKKASDYSVRWNEKRSEVPPKRQAREKMLKEINKKEVYVKKKQKARDAKAAIYAQDMEDFGKALTDIDGLKKILTNSAVNDKQTSGNAGKAGFLEGVDSVQSDRLRQMTHRLSIGANMLEAEDDDDEDSDGKAGGEGPSGVDKVMNLLTKVRNEMWKEMDKLTQLENKSINDWKVTYLRLRRTINEKHVQRAEAYVAIGKVLSEIGRLMIKEAEHRITSAKATKVIDATAIRKSFLRESCRAERPLYSKTRATKIAEIDTIKMMLKILANLNWSGAVYSAISRISTTGVDENPEPGYVLGYTMDIESGLNKNVYTYMNRGIKDFTRVAVKLSLGTQWVWASFDAFSDDSSRYLIPTVKSGVVNDRYIHNLHVFKSPSANVKSAHNQGKGYVEMWPQNYAEENTNNVPGANDGQYDEGDKRSDSGTYGCYQIHDFLQNNTVLAINNLVRHKDLDPDIGIGNNPSTKGHPDWTFSNSAKGYISRKEKMELNIYFMQTTPGGNTAPTTKFLLF